MGLINTTGYYKGTITSNALVKSSGGLPEEDLVLLAEEVYEQETQEWLPADFEDAEITGYFQLKGHEKQELAASKQLVKITEWDGQSLLDLLEMDLAGVPIQWRVEENTYKDNTSLKVTWIDPVGAIPGRSVASISIDEVKALQAEFSYKTSIKAVSAKGKEKGKDAPKTKGKSKPPKAPKATTPVGKCTDQEAYDACYSLKRDDVTDERLNELWVKMVAQVNEDEAAITPEQWYEIKEKLLKVTAKV